MLSRPRRGTRRWYSNSRSNLTSRSHQVLEFAHKTNTGNADPETILQSFPHPSKFQGPEAAECKRFGNAGDGDDGGGVHLFVPKDISTILAGISKLYLGGESSGNRAMD
jgi:hypothetical protein